MNQFDKSMWLLIATYSIAVIANCAIFAFLMFFQEPQQPINYQQPITIGEGNCHVETTIEVLPELVDMGVLKWLNACFATQK